MNEDCDECNEDDGDDVRRYYDTKRKREVHKERRNG